MTLESEIPKLANTEKSINITKIVLRFRYIPERKHFIHRNVMSSNILFTSTKYVKIREHGHTTSFESDLLDEYTGSLDYLAPVLLNHIKCNEKIDQYVLEST